MAQLSLYIPYIPDNITRSIIAYYFRNEDIGDIVNTHMLTKTNGEQTYSIALLKVRLYNTKRAMDFYTKVKLDGYYKFVYDEEAGYYWLIRLYDKNTIQRRNDDDITPVNSYKIPCDFSSLPSSFTVNEVPVAKISNTFQDYLNDVISFENLSREIGMTISNYAYELYGT
jgi:hypothetical protein|uniref:Uncharacterized protein n=1 Tax=viral metagenome TaxID=1070528 RepID=A0A6C0IU99_9ZZZZ